MKKPKLTKKGPVDRGLDEALRKRGILGTNRNSKFNPSFIRSLKKKDNE